MSYETIMKINCFPIELAKIKTDKTCGVGRRVGAGELCHR